MNHEETIFEQALGIGSEQAREEYLRGACAGNDVARVSDSGLRERVGRSGFLKAR
jgi:hypothetical protein